MSAELGTMLRFAMISAFLTAPVFAWLNFSLMRSERQLSLPIRVLAYLGLTFLIVVGAVFIVSEAGLV